MTHEERMKEFQRKQAFVRALNLAFPVDPLSHSVVKVDYEVYEKTTSEGKPFYKEYLVVTFRGGAISVRNANGNSHTANFRELGKMLDGGYYDEIHTYEALETELGFTKVEL